MGGILALVIVVLVLVPPGVLSADDIFSVMLNQHLSRTSGSEGKNRAQEVVELKPPVTSGAVRRQARDPNPDLGRRRVVHR